MPNDFSRAISDNPSMSANQLKSNLKEDFYAVFFFLTLPLKTCEKGKRKSFLY